jgi:outer membrane immunogenic protein
VKKIVSGIAAVVSMIGCHAAVAADLPAAPVKAPVAAAATVYNWTGAYVGLNGGWTWGDQDPLVLFGNAFDRTSMNMNGGMIGGTAGLQMQQGYVVLGVEGDLDWADIKGSYVTTPTILGGAILPGKTITLSMNSSISAYGSARIRAGVALNNMLLYVTGGVAAVKSSADGSSIAGSPCGTVGLFPNCSASAWRPGAVAGLGLEYGFTPNWSVKGEYLYTKVIGTGVSVGSLNTMRAGVNYRF